MVESLLHAALADWQRVLPSLQALDAPLVKVVSLLNACWAKGGKLLIAGNGGSAADAMHFAEELVVRFQKNRRGLAAIALCDPTVLTCAGNDLGYESVFSRQVEALGNPGDVLVIMTTSGNSPNLLRAISAAKEKQMATIAFLGRDGGRARGQCDVDLLVAANTSHRVQEAHKLLFHVICEWADQRYS